MLISCRDIDKQGGVIPISVRTAQVIQSACETSMIKIGKKGNDPLEEVLTLLRAWKIRYVKEID